MCSSFGDEDMLIIWEGRTGVILSDSYDWCGRYSPYIGHVMNNSNSMRDLKAIWDSIKNYVTYESRDEIRDNYLKESVCDRIFVESRISHKVLPRIDKRNIRKNKILIRHLNSGGSTSQSILDIYVMQQKAINPETIICVEDSFVVILADADYGLDVWVCDLKKNW